MKINVDGDIPQQLKRILNKGILFSDNLDGAFIEFETNGREQELEHNLGRIPISFLPIFLEGELTVWATEEQILRWTKNYLYLQSNVPNLTARLFVM